MKKTTYIILLLLTPILGYTQLQVIGGPGFNGSNIYNHCATPTTLTFTPDLELANASSYDLSLITWEVTYQDGNGLTQKTTVTGKSPNVAMTTPQSGAMINVWYKKGSPEEEVNLYNPINIFAERKPIITLNTKLIKCENNQETIIPTIENPNPFALYKYQWFNKNNTSISNSKDLSTVDTGRFEFQVSYTLPQNCITTESIYIKNITPSADLGENKEACRDEEIAILNNWSPNQNFDGILTYQWNDKTLTSNTYTTSSNGLFTLKLTAKEGNVTCPTVEDQVLVEEKLTPLVGLGNDIEVEEGPVELKNTINNGSVAVDYSYSWVNDLTGIEESFNELFYVIKSGEYNLTVTNDITGCSENDDIKVVIEKAPEVEPEPEGGNVFIATAFAPEGEVFEDRFLRVNGLNLSKDGFSFRVFDRWGGLVYETDNLLEAVGGWDGDGAPSGVYTYTVQGKYLDGTAINEAGTSTLIR